MFEYKLRGLMNSARTWIGLTVLAAGVFGLAACEGDNLFGDSTTSQPRASVSGPATVEPGDTFQVRVDAFAPRGVARVDVSLRGAVNRDTSFIGGTAAVESPVFKFVAPSVLTDSLVIVTARVTDRVGNVSRVESDTISALGGPAVISVIRPDSVRPGETITLRATLVGARRINAVNVQVRGAATLDQSIPVVPSFTVTQDIVLQIPTTVNDSLLRVSISARDESGVLGAPTTVNIPVSSGPPTVVLTAPATATAGANLDLVVRATGVRLVAAIKIELRGATNRDTTVTISPARGDVTQPISIRLPAEIQDPALTVRAYAIDTRNVIGPAQTATVTIPTGAPVILSVTVVTPAQTGGRFDVRVVARGSRLLSRIDVKFRGNGVVSPGESDQVFQVTPQRTDVTQDVHADILANATDSEITVLSTATDASGAVSKVDTLRVPIVDGSPPVVSLVTVTPATAAAGTSVSIRVNATDNRGLSSIGFEVRNAAGTVIGSGSTPTTGTSGTQTFSFPIPGGTPPGTYTVIGIATDSSGRQGQLTTNLTVT